MMTNVCRIFNDKVGAELVERTGRNPSYMYQSLGCSKKAVARMLGFAHHTRVRQEDGTRDKLMLAFGALDENEDKMLSFEEFRHASLVALSSVAAGPPTQPLQMGSGDMNAKL